MNGQISVKPTHCAFCGSPLVRINFRGGYWLVCDNWRCHLYRERQYTEFTESQGSQVVLTKRGKYIFRGQRNPSDKNQRKREHYQYARDHGLPSVLAGAICGNSIRYIDGQVALYMRETRSLSMG